MSSSVIPATTPVSWTAVPNGSAALPSFAFQNSSSTGIYRVAADSLGISTAGVQRVVVDASGNVGIGTGSPAQKLHIASGGVIRFNRADNSATAYGEFNYGGSGVGFQWNDTNSDGYTFKHAGTTVMRIDASGNLLVGTTSNPSNSRLRIEAAAAQEGIYVLGSGATVTAANNQPAGSGICYVAARATDGYLGYWLRNGVLIGSIYANINSTTYNTNSDYRLKEDIKPVEGALTKVSALKPCTYKWKSDGSEGEGFIAHELAEVCPAAVTGEKDAVNEDGSIKPQGIDPSKLIGLLTAAIQELSAKVDAQAAEIEALKAKP